MRARRRIDFVLLALLAPLWTLAVALHAVRAVEHRVAWLPVQVEAGPEGWPVVRGFVAGTGGGAPGLEVGDVLLRVGERDLRAWAGSASRRKPGRPSTARCARLSCGAAAARSGAAS